MKDYKHKFRFPFIVYLLTKFKNDSFIESLKLVHSNSNMSSILKETMNWEDEKYSQLIEKCFEIVNNTKNSYIKKYIFDEYKKMTNDFNKKIDFFKRYLTPSEDEKKILAEVFTDTFLIDEMLDKLPNEVWSNPNLKWLDPANGIGNFPFIIYQRLMKGLKEEINDLKMREKHILENMLYMVDISPKNTFICMNIFDPEDEYNLNIYRGDFLKEDINVHFSVDKFDIIIGNPPFNEFSVVGNKTSGRKIWKDFIKKSLLILEKDGYLTMISPPNWIFKHDTISKIVFEKNVEYINLDIGRYFPTVKESIGYFSLKNNCEKNGEYTFITTDNNNHIIEEDFILPARGVTDKILSIFKKTMNQKNKFNVQKYKIDISKINSDINSQYKVYNHVWGYEYTNETPLKEGQSKVFISRLLRRYKGKRILVTFHDENGSCHIKDGSFITINNKIEGDNLCFFLSESKLMKFISGLFDKSNYANPSFYRNVPFINLNTHKFNDDYIYRYFGLNDEEIELIENDFK
jgi:hypothetical protein